MSIPFNDNLDVRTNKLTTRREGPWESVAAALAGIPAWQRQQGITTWVIESGQAVKYYFRDGILDEHLIPYSAGGHTLQTPAGDDLEARAKLRAKAGLRLLNEAGVDFTSLVTDALLQLGYGQAGNERVIEAVSTDPDANLRLKGQGQGKVLVEGVELVITNINLLFFLGNNDNWEGAICDVTGQTGFPTGKIGQRVISVEMGYEYTCFDEGKWTRTPYSKEEWYIFPKSNLENEDDFNNIFNPTNWTGSDYTGPGMDYLKAGSIIWNADYQFIITDDPTNRIIRTARS